jgi:N utilization substance protein B
VKSVRHQAREAALGVLYFCEVGRAEPVDALEAYFAEHAPDAPEAVRRFAGELVRGTIGQTEALDALIGRHASNWRVDRLAVIDRLILRMAAWELGHVPDTPPAVVLNEAIELARAFGTDESPRFVNGVLDAIHRALRPDA